MSSVIPFIIFRHLSQVRTFFKSTVTQCIGTSFNKADGNVTYGAGTVMGDNVCIESDVVIGDNCFIGSNTVIRKGARIGEGSVIGHLVLVEQGVRIGAFSTVQSQCHITAFVTIEDNVFFGPGVICANDKKMVKYHPERGEYIIEAPVFKKGCSIGAGSVIMPGVTIGEDAIVGSGSVVSKNVPKNQTWYGCGAEKKVRKW